MTKPSRCPGGPSALPCLLLTVAGTPVEHRPSATSDSPSWSGPENTVPGEQGMEEEEAPGKEGGLGANPGRGRRTANVYGHNAPPAVTHQSPMGWQCGR